MYLVFAYIALSFLVSQICGKLEIKLKSKEVYILKGLVKNALDNLNEEADESHYKTNRRRELKKSEYGIEYIDENLPHHNSKNVSTKEFGIDYIDDYFYDHNSKNVSNKGFNMTHDGGGFVSAIEGVTKNLVTLKEQFTDKEQERTEEPNSDENEWIENRRLPALKLDNKSHVGVNNTTKATNGDVQQESNTQGAEKEEISEEKSQTESKSGSLEDLKAAIHQSSFGNISSEATSAELSAGAHLNSSMTEATSTELPAGAPLISSMAEATSTELPAGSQLNSSMAEATSTELPAGAQLNSSMAKTTSTELPAGAQLNSSMAEATNSELSVGAQLNSSMAEATNTELPAGAQLNSSMAEATNTELPVGSMAEATSSITEDTINKKLSDKAINTPETKEDKNSLDGTNFELLRHHPKDYVDALDVTEKAVDEFMNDRGIDSVDLETKLDGGHQKVSDHEAQTSFETTESGADSRNIFTEPVHVDNFMGEDGNVPDRASEVADSEILQPTHTIESKLVNRQLNSLDARKSDQLTVNLFI